MGKRLHTPTDGELDGSAATCYSMRTSSEYLALSERYRIAKLSARDAATQHQLDIFERSYFILAKSALLLVRSNAMREALEH